MVDFTGCMEEMNQYKGSEKKKTLIYNGKRYLVKFPDPIREKNKYLSYINNAFSEYIGSNVFQMIGFKTQNTILGTYQYKEKEKIVCACEDFTDKTHTLYEFESIVLSTNPDKKIETDLEDIIEVIEENQLVNKEDVKRKFFDMFIIDAFIGNTDRHNGNWGFLLNEETKEISFAPIYDCGSCLNPMLEDEELAQLSPSELKNLALNTFSCIKERGKKIPYLSYIASMERTECNQALVRVFEKINLTKILEFIDSISCISNVRKAFYKNLFEIRYEVLKKVYQELCSRNS